MSFSCDAKVLLHGSDSASPVHEAARAFLRGAQRRRARRAARIRLLAEEDGFLWVYRKVAG